MPTSLHELLVTLFHNRPELAPELVRNVLSIPLPSYAEVRVESGEVPQTVPPAYHADQVVVLYDGDRPVFAIVVEVQLGVDPDKRYTWLVYFASLRARFKCPTCVLVLAPSKAVAEWCAESVDLSPPEGNIWRPLVVGPSAVPVIRDPEEAKRDPELAVLSALAHGSDPERGLSVGAAALEGCFGLDTDRAMLYWELVLDSMPEAARRALEEKMLPHGYELKTEGARRLAALISKGKDEGRAEGEARALLTFLEARGLAVSDEQRERIRSCTDLATLDRWTRQAVSVSSTDELFVG